MIIPKLLLLILILSLSACTKWHEGVYTDESGYSTLIVCEKETSPNNRDILFCHRDYRDKW